MKKPNRKTTKIAMNDATSFIISPMITSRTPSCLCV